MNMLEWIKTRPPHHTRKSAVEQGDRVKPLSCNVIGAEKIMCTLSPCSEACLEATMEAAKCQGYYLR